MLSGISNTTIIKIAQCLDSIIYVVVIAFLVKAIGNKYGSKRKGYGIALLITLLCCYLANLSFYLTGWVIASSDNINFAIWLDKGGREIKSRSDIVPLEMVAYLIIMVILLSLVFKYIFKSDWLVSVRGAVIVTCIIAVYLMACRLFYYLHTY